MWVPGFVMPRRIDVPAAIVASAKQNPSRLPCSTDSRDGKSAGSFIRAQPRQPSWYRYDPRDEEFDGSFRYSVGRRPSNVIGGHRVVREVRSEPAPLVVRHAIAPGLAQVTNVFEAFFCLG